MKKIITFIVLAYNVEPYLKKCLDSFLCQPVLEQIEVIIIDDGSTDATAEIADSYVSRFPQIFRVIHKENGGHGSGINSGSRIAKGKYFKAIDADDWVLTENLSAFIAELENCDADVVLTPFHTVDMMTGKQTPKHMHGQKWKDIQIKDILDNWSSFEDCCVFHGITYRSDFYRADGHMLPEHIFYEDQEYNTIPFCKAEHIAVFDIYIYQYLIGNAQQSVSYTNQAKRIDHLARVVWDMIDYYKTLPNFPEDAKTYLFSKIEAVCLIYLMTACIYEQNKHKGRNLRKDFEKQLNQRLPEMRQRIRRKSLIYWLMNLLHITPEWYQSWIQSDGYRKLKNGVQDMRQADQ